MPKPSAGNDDMAIVTRSRPGVSTWQGGFAMSWRRNILVSVIFVGSLASSGHAYDFGRTATPEEIKLWDIDVRPDGKGLLDGSGTAAHGKAVYEQNCEACHGPNGQAGSRTAWLAGKVR
jgi:cytochrome c